MNNSRYYALCREWREQEHDPDFLDFVEKHYPGVHKYLNTQDFRGLFPLTPPTYDSQVILLEWQKNHRFVHLEIKRAPHRREHERSYI